MSRHVSAENLALYQEDALSPRKLARIRSHLSGCDTCSATISGLAAVPGLLARTTAPPMPDRVTARIQAVLAREVAARAEAGAHAGPAGAHAGPASAHAGPAGAHAGAADRGRGAPAAGAAGEAAPVPVPGRPDLPERARRRSWRPRMPDLTSPLVLRALAATGAVVLIAGVGFLFANTQTSQTSSRGIAARPESPAAGSPVGRARSTNQSAEPLSVHYRRNGKSVATTVLTSNVNFTRKSLGEQAHEQVSRSPRFETAAPHAALGGAANGMSVSQIGECLTKVAAGRKVLVADLARYIGKRALIIIMRPLRIVDVLDVVVVGLACSASDTHAVTTFQVPAS